jgi:hypothetical protein
VNGTWAHYQFRGTAWQNVKNESQRTYLANAYRVLRCTGLLLTAAHVVGGNDMTADTSNYVAQQRTTVDLFWPRLCDPVPIEWRRFSFTAAVALSRVSAEQGLSGKGRPSFKVRLRAHDATHREHCDQERR